jgi:hypothetical protein
MQRSTMSSAISVKPIAHLHQRQAPGEIRERHAEYRHLLKLPQRLHLAFRIVRRQALGSRVEFVHEARARRQLIEGIGIDQLVQQQREIRDLPRQKTADRAYLDERSNAGGCSFRSARYEERAPMASKTRSTRCTTVAGAGREAAAFSKRPR